MPRFSRQQKDDAFENQEKATRMTIASGFFATALAAIPGPGPLLALAPAALGAAYGSRALAQGRIVRDPPDPDFRTPTQLGPVELDLSVLGDSPLESSSGELALANEHAATAARALVRALERAMGAELADEEAYARARFSESVEYAWLLADNLAVTARLVGRVREALEALPRIHSVVDGEGIVLENVLPDQTLAGLYRMGIRRSYITEPLSLSAIRGESVDPLTDFVAGLTAMADADAAYSASIRQQLEVDGFFDDQELPI